MCAPTGFYVSAATARAATSIPTPPIVDRAGTLALRTRSASLEVAHVLHGLATQSVARDV